MNRYVCVSVSGCCEGPQPCEVGFYGGDGVVTGHYRICCADALENRKNCDCPCHLCKDSACTCWRHGSPPSTSAAAIRLMLQGRESRLPICIVNGAQKLGQRG